MLNIKEPELKRRHEQILENLIANNLNPECEYQEGEPGTNSSVSYILVINNVYQYGIIAINEGQFNGAVCNLRKIKQHVLEGFEDEQIDNEPVWAIAPCPMSFVCMLAMPLLEELQFSDDLMEEYQKAVAAETRKNAKRTSRKKNK